MANPASPSRTDVFSWGRSPLFHKAAVCNTRYRSEERRVFRSARRRLVPRHILVRWPIQRHLRELMFLAGGARRFSTRQQCVTHDTDRKSVVSSGLPGEGWSLGTSWLDGQSSVTFEN